jgi:hypothetical protein
LNTSLSSTVKKSEVTTPSSSTTTFRKNIYSRDLVKMLYIDPDAAEYSKLKKDIGKTKGGFAS